MYIREAKRLLNILDSAIDALSRGQTAIAKSETRIQADEEISKHNLCKG